MRKEGETQFQQSPEKHKERSKTPETNPRERKPETPGEKYDRLMEKNLTAEGDVEQDMWNETLRRFEKNRDKEAAIPQVSKEARSRFFEKFLDGVSEKEMQSMTASIERGMRKFAKEQADKHLSERDKLSLEKLAKKFLGDNYETVVKGSREVADLHEKGQSDQALDKGINLIENMKDEFKQDAGEVVDEIYQDYDKKAAKAEAASPENQSKLKRIALEAADLIPVAGPLKMIGESIAGTKLSGEKMTWKERTFHAVEGAVFLALDLTGVGVVAKGAKAAKLLTRSSALMRATKMPRAVYKPVFKTGKYLNRHPNVAKTADKMLQFEIWKRKREKNKWIRSSTKGVLIEGKEEAA
ncbi:hypothetical protein ACFL2D_02050 [Patescibacteria group bacterium]